ncbi:MAG: lipopolysaccharide biosynthesis protein [Betaproteobacteria bacterium]|nr:MAG: lipopolysaccharide biosynthesis protein [Betaproteobacteria bacterium]
MSTVQRSLWISAVDSYSGLFLQLAGAVIIARVLTPKEIGIFAVAAVFSGLASMFRDFGIAEYMIQEKELTSQKIAAALTLNIIVSWAMASAMFLGGPLAAAFYGNPGIAAVMRVQSMSFLLVPFGAVTMAYFRRELDLRPLLICNFAGNVTAFAVSVSLALLGFGYMSLAWSGLAAIAVTVAGSVWFRPATFPRWPSLLGLAEVFHFSKFASSVYIVGQVGKGAPEMIIGRAQGMVAVAMFSRANGLVEMFNRLALRPVMLVCMPYFAKSDREQGAIAEAYLKSVSYLTAVGWPFLAFMGIAALSAIRIVYGPQWDAAVHPAQILCAAFALELVHVMSREALLARGEARAANSLQIGMLLFQIIGLLAAIPFGIIGAAWGVLAASGCGIYLSQWYLARGIGLRASELLRSCVPSLYLTIGAVAPAAAWAMVTGVTLDNYVSFGVIGGLMTATSWLFTLHLLKHPLMKEIVESTRHTIAVLRPKT